MAYTTARNELLQFICSTSCVTLGAFYSIMAIPYLMQIKYWDDSRLCDTWACMVAPAPGCISVYCNEMWETYLNDTGFYFTALLFCFVLYFYTLIYLFLL